MPAMATALMEDDVGKLHAAVGSLRSEVKSLFDKFERLEETTITEQRKVHDIVVAQSEAVRNLDRDVREMKPVTDEYRLNREALEKARKLAEDYREERAEKRGEDKFKKWLYGLAASVGGLIAMILGKLFDKFTAGPPPH